ncbi:hypothetical protein BGZ46_009977 [Entomortierella lignicola]|nr:hypothetical protein BGZ46_009977 [Entomortierella lignicola]
MPWHDVSLAVVGQAARDIARHFVQRWNFVKREKGMRKSHMKFLMPKGEFDNSRNETNWTGSQKVQVLRSSCGWSQGVELECSIQNAYISSILKSKHFIYIENQFFVTLGTEGGNPDIKNRIGIAIVERILRAFREGTRFRVIVVMPLMPAFEADIMTSDAGTLRKVMHYQYQSICRGGHSILERILSHGIDPFEYIGFYGLRSYDRIKHGKFDAIVEAIKEAELDDGTSLGNTLATTAVTNDLCKKNSRNELGKKNSRNELSKKASKGIGLCPSSATQENTELDHPDGLAPRKSLAAKFLLEEIPKGKEAERIIAISERRREYDRQRTWDESISKRAMNPAKEELGYVPATTSEALADKETTAQVARETLKAEADAIEKGYRQSGRTSPEITEGVGTAIRNVIEGIKGTKDDGNLKPLGQRLRDTKDLNIDGLGKKKHHLRQNIKNAFRGYDDEFFQSELDAINDTEKIVEPGLPKHTVIETDSNSSPEDSTTVDAGESTDSLRLRPNSTIEETASSIGDDSSSIGDILMPPNVKNMPSSNRRQKRPKKPRGPVVDDEVDDFVTELLYIHSKLMIVDDRIIICGSANLNDRSQLGVRDSEIAIYIEDTEMIDSKMDGKPYLAGKLAHGLRTSLFKEHLGLLPHVGHDVITKNSVLPVDLDAPDKDPELQRDELIRKANENLGRDLKNQQRNQQYDQRQPYPSRSTSSHGVDDSGIGSSNGLHDSGIGSSNGLYDSGIGSSNGVHSTDLSSSDIGGSGTSSSSSSTNGGTGVNNNSQPGISLNKGEIHHLAEDKEMGDIKAYIPDPEEIKDIKRWQSTSEMVHKEAKILTADDPAAADLVVRDPLNDDFYLGWWKRVAKTNTLIFREVFRCVPDDTVENWDQYKAFIPNPKKVLAGHVALEGASAKEVKERLKNITGHLVEFPLKFLYEENLIGAAESAVVPMEIFT